MKKYLLMLTLFSFTLGLTYCGSGSGGGNYPALSDVLTKIIKVVKDNKDKPEEAKKQAEALISGLDKTAIAKEQKAFGEVMKKQMEALKPKEGAGMGDIKKIMEVGMNAMKKELPQMGELMDLAKNPDYAKVMAAVGPILKSLKP